MHEYLLYILILILILIFRVYFINIVILISTPTGVGPELYDCVIVDFSPLRLVDVSEPAGLCLEVGGWVGS